MTRTHAIPISAVENSRVSDPTIFTIGKGPVRVVTDGIAIGETIMPAYVYQLELLPWRGRPDVTTATDVDVTRFLDTFESVKTRK